MKKAISFLLSLLICLNCVSPVFANTANAAGIDSPKLIFKYYDVEAGRYLNADECFYADKYYELRLFVDDIEGIMSLRAPIRFNTDVLQLVTFGNAVVENYLEGDIFIGDDEVIHYEVDYENNSDFFDFILTGNNPQIYVDEGVIKADSSHPEFRPMDISNEMFLYSVRFKAVSNGNTEIGISNRNTDPAIWSEFEEDGAAFACRDSEGNIIPVIPEIVNPGMVVASKANGVDIAQSQLEISIGDTIRLRATVSPTDAFDKTVIWSSEDEGIAKVDQNGYVTGIKEGETKIIATTRDGGFIDTCTIKVINDSIPTKPTNLTIVSKTGKSVEFAWSESTGKKRCFRI